MDPRGWAWTYTEELLATASELIDLGNRMFYSANSKKGARVPKPIEIKRPWQPEQEAEVVQMRPKASHDEIVAFFGRRD